MGYRERFAEIGFGCDFVVALQVQFASAPEYELQFDCRLSGGCERLLEGHERFVQFACAREGLAEPLVVRLDVKAVASRKLGDVDALGRILRMEVERQPLDLSAVPALDGTTPLPFRSYRRLSLKPWGRLAPGEYLAAVRFTAEANADRTTTVVSGVLQVRG